ncbi:hypothetical protein ABIE67_004970 [Streptomyces sp. V4I8]|uniref:hypothetical protein n=1 Tax=Streptomyces sp. V4I8 TaxID=3156469 RepID=UPI0035179AA5
MRSMHPRIHDAESARDTPEVPSASAYADEDPPAGEFAEVRIIAANPDTAQRVAQLLRQGFRCDEPRSYPAGADGHGTLLHLTVDTAHPSVAPSSAPASSWLTSSRSQAQRAHTDEPG